MGVGPKMDMVVGQPYPSSQVEVPNLGVAKEGSRNLRKGPSMHCGSGYGVEAERLGSPRREVRVKKKEGSHDFYSRVLTPCSIASNGARKRKGARGMFWFIVSRRRQDKQRSAFYDLANVVSVFIYEY